MRCAAPPAAAGTPSPIGEWRAAEVPGIVGPANDAPTVDLHAQDHWYRRDGSLPGYATLEFTGLATLAEIWLDGTLAARSDNMFVPLSLPVPAAGATRLEICFRALRPRLRQRLPGPRPRWKGRLTTEETLRGVRTTLLGHMPGWSADTPVIGPYRPILLHRKIAGTPAIYRIDLRTRLEPGGAGVIECRLEGDSLADQAGLLRALSEAAPFRATQGGLHAVLSLADPPRWWPHTHGEPTTIPVVAEIGGQHIDLGPVGFRTVERRPRANGFGLVVNGEPVFCRGAVWAGLDPTARPDDPAALRHTLDLARRAGLNMIRVCGLTTYATAELLSACDELGILVWHDFMFTRFDYPGDDAFLDAAAAEARAFLHRTAAHPSLAVLCGGSENAQVAAMSGCRPDAWQAPLFEQVLSREAAALRPDIPYLPQSPLAAGNGLPIAAAADVAHYFGVGAYRRPLHDLDTAGVRFAAECLAFANLPEPAACRDHPADAPPPRDLGADWDFADIRDHYVGSLFGATAAIRRQDPAAWSQLGRVTVAYLVQHALAAWRTDGICAGAIVLMLRDVLAGPGWGVIGADGRPKSPWFALRSVCQPLQLLLRDRGQNGVVLHALNETATRRRVHLRLRGLLPDGVAEDLGAAALDLPARSHRATTATDLLGRWRDIADAWQFGPPSFIALGATLEDFTGTRLSEAALFPCGPDLPRGEAGLTARLGDDGHRLHLEVAARGFAQFVQIYDDSCTPADNYFHLWPGERRVVALHPHPGHARRAGGKVVALNAFDSARYGLAA